MHDLSEIAVWCGGESHIIVDTKIKYLLTDSRATQNLESSLFIAIVGERHNAHNYIEDLYNKGARNFLVSQKDKVSQLENANFIYVENTLRAVQLIASKHRDLFHIPVIGITGSNGKTVVKEWLFQLLNSKYTICRSPKSYNSQIGVPLSVWQLDENDTLGIFEAGISQSNEMEYLKEIIKPTIGVLTNIGEAHNEGFSSKQEKLNEKLKLFKNTEKIICNGDDLNVLQQIDKTKLITWGKNGNNAVVVSDIIKSDSASNVKLSVSNQDFLLELPFSDNASIENAITCFCVLLQLNQLNDETIAGFKSLQPIAMRLEMKQGINNSLIINDSYNSDYNSIVIALDFLSQQKFHKNKVVILSDILQSGKNAKELYHSIAKLLIEKGINTIVGIGKEIGLQKDLFEIDKLFFQNNNEFLHWLKTNNNKIFANSTILLKGAREFHFEEINRLLQQKSHDTVLEINLNNLVHNVNYFKSKLNPGVKLMCMVKASGYGNGSYEIAATLQHQRVDYLAVAYADEGVELRKAGITLPIMVMSPEEQAFDDFIEFNLEPEVYSFRVLNLLDKFIRSQNLDYKFPIHLKLDTGMHRLGFDFTDVDSLCSYFSNDNPFEVKSIFSHLAASDEPTMDDYTNLQLDKFDLSVKEIVACLKNKPLLHIANSAAIARFPNAQYNMVRLGIGMYGVASSEDDQKKLVNVGSLTTTISQIKKLKTGSTVGYSRKGKIERDSIVATVPIGYADGLSRKLSNGKGVMYINNQPAPIVGNVCMDMCMLDITGIDCKEGDTVVVFDTIERLSLLAKQAETISYEVLTSVSSRVKRIYIQE